MPENIRIILIETTHPGNIGAVARAMKNMCLRELVLVQPQCDHLSDEAIARASGAQDVLHNAQVYPDLVSAVADCHTVIGSSARHRSTLWSVLTPNACAKLLVEQASVGPVGLVFGRESAGLSAAELDHCTHLVYIPANPDYSSLNIAMAVQVLAYELRQVQLHNQGAAPSDDKLEPPANIQQMEGLFAHLEQVLYEVDFLQAGREGKMMQRLRRLLHRASPTEREAHILRGILSAVHNTKSTPG